MKKIFSIFSCMALGATLNVHAADAPANPAVTELRLFTVGNSFHFWLPTWLAQVEAETDIKGHQQLGVSYIGGSKVIQHWMIPDDKNQVKASLIAGKVDVLTLDAMLSPDPGIDNFAELGLKSNPNLRVTLQEFWLPHDRLDDNGGDPASYGDLEKQLRTWDDPPIDPKDPKKGALDTSHFNIPTADQLEKLHAPYFEKYDAYVRDENKKFAKQVIFVVPVGQAILALRRMIIDGKVPGISKQSDLFSDSTGHPREAIKALAAYCHFAVIYHRNPEGLPLLPGLAQAHYSQELNLLLQKLAWEAVSTNPLSGCGNLKPNGT